LSFRVECKVLLKCSKILEGRPRLTYYMREKILQLLDRCDQMFQSTILLSTGVREQFIELSRRVREPQAIHAPHYCKL
jgi:hypothetical protein